MDAYTPYWFKPCWTKDSGRLLYYAVYDGPDDRRTGVTLEARFLLPTNVKRNFKTGNIGSLSYLANQDGIEAPDGSIILIDRTEGLIIARERHFHAFYTTIGG